MALVHRALLQYHRLRFGPIGPSYKRSRIRISFAFIKTLVGNLHAKVGNAVEDIARTLLEEWDATKAA